MNGDFRGSGSLCPMVGHAQTPPFDQDPVTEAAKNIKTKVFDWNYCPKKGLLPTC
jgi:hypothetical protein